jgi:hypothetical protein
MPMPQTPLFRSRLRLLALGCGLGGSIVAACTVFDDVTISVQRPPAPGPTCARATFPPPPDKGKDGADLPGIVIALYALDFEGGKGIDQDGVCTCVFDAGPSCTNKTGIACDDENGRDNAFPAFVKRSRKAITDKIGAIPLPFDLTPLLDKLFDFNKRSRDVIDGGNAGILLYVSNYNGQPDDPYVQVEIRQSGGITNEVPVNSSGLNTYTVFKKGLQDNAVADGFVAGGILYATLKKTEFEFDVGSVVRFSTARISAKLSKLGANYTIDSGELSGRWNQEDFLQVVDQIRLNNVPGIQANDAGVAPQVCTVRKSKAKEALIFEPLANQLISDVCNAGDLRTSPTDDGSGQDCDAISTTIQFKGAAVALPVAEVDKKPTENVCGFETICNTLKK